MDGSPSSVRSMIGGLAARASIAGATGAPEGPLLRNPTWWLFIAAAIVAAIGVGGYVTGRLGAAATVFTNALALYLGFTVVHDGVHGVVHRDPRAGRVLATFWGFFLTFTFPFFRSIHLEHHARANDPERDPDCVTAQLPRVVVPFIGGLFIFASYQVHYFRRRLWRSRAELIEVVACDAFYLGIFAASLAGGWHTTLGVLWILPLTVTLLFLVFTFDYLPHQPHDSAEPHLSSRAYGGRLATAIFLGQNYHLIHHLWPRLPWYAYRGVFLEAAEPLRALGCRIGWRLESQKTSDDAASAATTPESAAVATLPGQVVV
jgi:beta-carotene hydroxylase